MPCKPCFSYSSSARKSNVSSSSSVRDWEETRITLSMISRCRCTNMQHAHLYVGTYTHMHACMRTHTHTYTYTHTYTHAHIDTHAQTHARIQRCTQTCSLCHLYTPKWGPSPLWFPSLMPITHSNIKTQSPKNQYSY